jgi:uncharacterized protein (UPF0276 family)
MDLRWADPAGFQTGPAGDDGLAPALRAFLRAQAPGFAHAFFSWQPRDRARLRVDDYAPAWDQLMSALPAALPRALHHTALNLAALASAPSAALLDFTNALCERYRLRWVNEDVGFWSLAGRPVPYPLPPILDATGLRACVRNVRQAQRGLAVPLVVEFPGFAAGVSLVMGDLDAYDFFRVLAEETGAPVTLDVGHLLSWRWWRGFRGQALFDDLARLPLAHAFEIHLSGCELDGDRFVDAHHGRLLDEQLVMLERLLPLCPNLHAVTFEDPRLQTDGDGTQEPASQRSLDRLRQAVGGWSAPPSSLGAATDEPVRLQTVDVDDGTPDDVTAGTETALTFLLFDSDVRAAWRNGTLAETVKALATLVPDELEAAASAARAMVQQRAHRGTGRLADAFPRCIAGWRAAHPDDQTLDALFDRFLASAAVAPWHEQPGREGGASIEECFAAFARAAGLAEPLVCEEELLSVLLRALTVTPQPAFLPPPAVRRAPGGWFAVSAAEPPVLHAALRGRYWCGPITPLIAATLLGRPSAFDAPSSTDSAAVAAVRARLVAMELL